MPMDNYDGFPEDEDGAYEEHQDPNEEWNNLLERHPAGTMSGEIFRYSEGLSLPDKLAFAEFIRALPVGTDRKILPGLLHVFVPSEGGKVFTISKRCTTQKDDTTPEEHTSESC